MRRAKVVVTLGVEHEAQAAGVVAFAVQPRIGIGAGVVGRVAAFFAMKASGVSFSSRLTITGCVTLITGTTIIVGHETLMICSSPDEFAIDTEVFTREQVPGLGLFK